MAGVADLARVFTGDKTVDNRALNAAGVQPLRAIVARLLYKLHRGSDDPDIAGLVRTGILTCDDFLPPEVFAAVEAEATAFMSDTDPTWLHEHGTTQVRHYLLSTVDEGRFPRLAEWRGHERVLAMASAAERRRCRKAHANAIVEHVSVGDYAEHDPQTDLHVDTFFNTHKVWLYLDDVSPRNAPLVYVPGSHRLDLVRLRGEYFEAKLDDPEKSRRVTDEEIQRRGLERRVVTCRRNTLVIVNTCGYHCRSVGTEDGAVRRALHMSFRFNPFRYRARRPSRLRRSASRLAQPAA
jgi:hypothetical protein